MSMMLYYTSLYWISGASHLISSIVKGGCRLILGKFDPTTVSAIIEKYRVTFMFMSPYLVIQFIKFGRKDKDTSSLKSMAVGGGKVIEEHLAALQKMLPNVVICYAYGTTEIHGIATHFHPINDENIIKRKLTSVGKPAPDHFYKVIIIMDLPSRLPQ